MCTRDVAEGRAVPSFAGTIVVRAVLGRSLRTAIVIGTILVAINQGPALAIGRVSTDLAWKVPLDYLVPFLVATWGALGTLGDRRSVVG